jgi:predicted ester cyclase
MDVEPTGKEVTVTGLTISRLEDGKISEEFRNWDFYGMIRQVEGASARVRA